MEHATNRTSHIKICEMSSHYYKKLVDKKAKEGLVLGMTPGVVVEVAKEPSTITTAVQLGAAVTTGVGVAVFAPPAVLGAAAVGVKGNFCWCLYL